MIASIVFVVLVLAAIAAGALLGFGRSLSRLTDGIVGIVLAIVFCCFFGESIRSIGFIANWIGGRWYFIILYYVILFAVAQLARFLITLIIERICDIDVLAVNIINRILGAVLLSSLIIFGTFALLAGFYYLANHNVLFLDEMAIWVRDTILEDDSWLRFLYDHNFIVYGK